MGVKYPQDPTREASGPSKVRRVSGLAGCLGDAVVAGQALFSLSVISIFVPNNIILGTQAGSQSAPVGLADMIMELAPAADFCYP